MTDYKPSGMLLRLKRHLDMLYLSDVDFEIKFPGSSARGDYYPFKFGFARENLKDAIQEIEKLEKGLAELHDDIEEMLAEIREQEADDD